MRQFVHRCLEQAPLEGRSVCVVVPDSTRTCPLPLLLEAVHRSLHGRVSRLTVLIALGTHSAMTDRALAEHLGYPLGDLTNRYPGSYRRQPCLVGALHAGRPGRDLRRPGGRALGGPA